MALVINNTIGMMEEPKAVHPFFSRPTGPHQEQSQKDVSPAVTACTAALVNEPPLKPTRGAGKRSSSKKDGKSDSSKLMKSSPSSAMLEVDPNNSRRKRAKTSLSGGGVARQDAMAGEPLERAGPMDGLESEGSPMIQAEELVFHTPGDVVMSGTNATPNGYDEDVNREHRASKHLLSAASKEVESVGQKTTILEPKDGRNKNIAASLEHTTQVPTKILRFNPKTGTIGSPPSKKPIQVTDPILTEKQPKPRGRKPRSKILILRYGHDLESRFQIASQINQILKGIKSGMPNQEVEVQVLSENSKPFATKKAVHPFFSGKAPIKSQLTTHPLFSGPSTMHGPTLEKVVHATKTSAHPTVSMVSSRGRPVTSDKSTSAFGGFGKSEKLFKFPGVMEPAWPWKDVIHVRGRDDICVRELTSELLEPVILAKNRKSKDHAVEVHLHEDVMRILAEELNISDTLKCLKDLNLDDFNPPPPCLRLPKKHFETGLYLQSRVRKETHANLQSKNPTAVENSSDEEIQTQKSIRAQVHPALTKLYSSIATSLSPFDQSQCETQSWISKYSPKSASEVLQVGREAVILKEWLQTLTVLSVETGSENTRTQATSNPFKRSASSKVDGSEKRKRKSKKLDDFIVSSDEEDNYMDEISDLEDCESPHGSQGLNKKTVIRARDAAAKGSKDASKFMNAVVISGPHGSGKTAAVYAVAKELGFEVFEINSSSRRSGKDVLEKVGDMTRNHLVQGLNKQAKTDYEDDDMRQISDALAEDLKSGRQGTMNSFFKPKGPAKPKAAQKKVETIPDNIPKTASKQQKQSLILLEEVDILYEEDKQFWTTVVTLIAQSKRPVIMTCTDESALPLGLLRLHAILRFTPPPTDLAVDYMLLLAANEGHVIRREAVKALYQSRQLDLRASLTELDFWCQFAVGDIKGGLEWFYPRWPPGSDIDEHGDTIRVISEGTYQTGMGWLCQDILESHSHYLDIEEETLHESWEGWNLDVGDWQRNLDMSTWASKIQSHSTGAKDEGAALRIYDDFAEAMSVADLCSGSDFASHNYTPLDISLPEMSTKTKEDYVLAHPLLEASSLAQYHKVGSDISMWIKSRNRKHLQIDQHIRYGWEVPQELERPSEMQILNLIRAKSTSIESSITRRDFSLAFDPIAESEKSATTSLEPSCFDRTMTIVATDIAPYVRSIVAYDTRLQQDRTRLGNLLSEGGRKGKRLRTTRSAMSALEGGSRSTTRRERYFGPNLNPEFVLKTGLPSWHEAVAFEMSDAGTPSRRSSPEGSVECDTFKDKL